MPGKIVRKVQLTGGSTYIVSLPKSWVKLLSLKPGDEVEISQDKNLRLIIAPRTSEQKQERAVISCENLKPDFAIREFIAYYMAGYVTVSLSCGKMKPEDRSVIKDAIRKRLLGAEVVEEDADSLTVQFLVNEKDLPISRAISRAATISQNMLKDVITAMENWDVDIAREVTERDDEVDRFYFYVSRQLSLSVSNFEILEEEGYNIAQIVDIHSAIKSIERIADHSSRIAGLIPQFNGQRDKDLIEFGKLVLEVYKRATSAFIEGRKDIANKLIEEDAKIAEIHRQVSSKVLSSDSPYKISFLMTSDSFRRISRYSMDLAETSINILAKRRAEYEELRD
ncbi:MAG: AbrB/MazE/SpoVT family DNA-binding domain-containing protein [Candidatus Aramenus sp.]|jgi:phosphate uptake regulator|nr:AbrB/MazE/SpoVT family DNA-binding domain-containing protein [Candidatus Aramenus sp.]